MKNIKYFPCERNQYFYGKLLSVDDFETEQKYMNDKRRLINRFLHGYGVVCGFGVIPVSDDTVCVEAGMALDFAGREIIADKPVTKRLTDMEGFSSYSQEESSYLYLCVEYDEQEKDPVYSVAGGGDTKGQPQFNKAAEGCRIYLTTREPEQETTESSASYEEWKTIYWGSGIRIVQIFPRYVKSQSEFEVRLIVENMGQKLPVSFSYELLLDCIQKDGKKRFKIEFDETKREKARRYEITFTLMASAVKDVKGSAKIKSGSFKLRIGEHNIEAGPETESTTEITGEEISEVLKKRYFENAMKEIKKDTYHQGLYLARISLVQAGSTIVIDDVEQMPFEQYICSDILSSVLEKAASAEQKNQIRSLLAKAAGDLTKGDNESESVLEKVPGVSCGTAVLELGIGGTAGHKFFSEPVTHGLGLGNVAIILGEAYESKDGSSVVYGSGSVFEDDAYTVRGELAAKVERGKGTFVIGMKLLEPTTAGKVKIHWTAVREAKEQESDKKYREMFLKPDMVYLSLREDYYFEPVFAGANDKSVTWLIREENGGSIDENGMYTAPNIPGIYEVVAKSTAYPGLEASAFAVVRDIKKE